MFYAWGRTDVSSAQLAPTLLPHAIKAAAKLCAVPHDEYKTQIDVRCSACCSLLHRGLVAHIDSSVCVVVVCRLWPCCFVALPGCGSYIVACGRVRL